MIFLQAVCLFCKFIIRRKNVQSGNRWSDVLLFMFKRLYISHLTLIKQIHKQVNQAGKQAPRHQTPL